MHHRFMRPLALVVAAPLALVACADAPPSGPASQPSYAAVAKRALGTVYWMSQAPTAQYALSRSITRGGDEGFRFTTRGGAARTVFLEPYEQLLVAQDVTTQGSSPEPSSIVEVWRIQAHEAGPDSRPPPKDSLDGTRPWSDREMMRVAWDTASFADEGLVDAQGAPVRRAPRADGPGAAPIAAEIYCGDALCANPSLADAHITRVVTYTTVSVLDASQRSHDVVVRIELRRTQN